MAKPASGLPCFDASVGRWVVIGRNGTKDYYYRVVMAAHLGRDLSPDEHIHHINGDKTDDRLENLVVMSKSQHSRLHARSADRPRVKWARGYDCCRLCGNNQRRHDGHGLCGACYQRTGGKAT